MDQLRAQDLLLQVDAGSLRGRFGRRAQAAAIRLTEAGKADFVGSDGHYLEKRPQLLRSAYEQVVQLAGSSEAQRLFVHNPKCVLTGDRVQAGSGHGGEKSPGLWARLRQGLA